jgi:hypothetical protein
MREFGEPRVKRREGKGRRAEVFQFMAYIYICRWKLFPGIGNVVVFILSISLWLTTCDNSRMKGFGKAVH